MDGIVLGPALRPVVDAVGSGGLGGRLCGAGLCAAEDGSGGSGSEKEGDSGGLEHHLDG